MMIHDLRIWPRLLLQALIIIIALLAVNEASANAWPREQGRSFLSLSIQSTVGGLDYGDYGSLYYEYGLTEQITLGIDAGRNLLFDDRSALFFLQGPLRLSDGPDLFSFELGIGGADVSGQWRSAFRPGMSWGRPYETPWARGWIGVDATYAMYKGGDHLGKVDATFGINHDNGSLTITQLQFAAPSAGESTLALAPSHVLPLGANSFIELGGVYQFNDGITSLKLGIWTNF